MSEGWIEVELGNYVDIISSKRIFASDYTESGIPFYRSKEIIDKALGQYIEDELFISHKRFNAIKEKFGAPKKGELLMSAVGNRSGIAYSIKEEYDFYFKDGNLIWFKNFSPYLNSQFLEYFFKSRIGQFKLGAVMIGSAQKALTIVGVKSIDLLLPPIREQETIVSIIRSIDEKINLLRQQNATLEAMAQALFKSWFVDFDPVIDNALAAGRELPEALAGRVARRRAVLAAGDYPVLPVGVRGLFPDSFVFSEELGRWVPEGWEVNLVSTVAQVNPESWTAKSHPNILNYVDLSSVSRGTIDEATVYTFDEAPSRAKRVLQKHDTIIGLVRPGNKSFAYINMDGLTGSTGFAVLRSLNENTRAFIYLLLTQESSTEYFAHVADGGAYPAIRPDVVGDFQWVLPKTGVLNFFQQNIATHFDRLATNNQQIQTLTRLRDVLLPELISGRVRV